MKYYVTFLGNDTFRATYPVQAANITDAVKQGYEMLAAVERQTIEQVRVAGVEEEQLTNEYFNEYFGPQG